MTEYFTCKDCRKAHKLNWFDAYECRNRSPVAGAARPWPDGHMDNKPVWPIVRGDEWCAEVVRHYPAKELEKQ